MQPWEIAVTTILGAGGGVILTKVFDIFAKSTSDVAKTSLKERSKQEVKRIELTGDAHRDISRIAERMYSDQKASQVEINDLHGEMASLETANNILRESFEKMRGERDVALAQNKEFVSKVTDLIAQSKDLAHRLATKEIEYAKLSIEHEGAKARIDKLLATIDEMTAWLDESNAEKARLESELERARTRE